MKRALLMLLSLAMLFNCFALLVSADDSADVVEDIFLDNEYRGEIQLCRYDATEKTINISGTISHDVMVTHRDYRIALYTIPLGENANNIVLSHDVIPTATTEISVKFTFSIKVKSDIERFYLYAVVIYNDEGDVIAIGDPVYPDVEADYSDTGNDKRYYKGVTSELISNATDAGVGTAIIPIYLDELLSKTSTGYVCSVNDDYVYFDKDYVNTLDAKIQVLGAIGCRVYIQFLMGEDIPDTLSIHSTVEGEQAIPDMSDVKTIEMLSAFTEFICERYDSKNHRNISGIIISRRIDRACADPLELDAYAYNYMLYMMLISNVARLSIPNIDIVLPFSDVNSYNNSEEINEGCPPSLLIEKICSLTEKHFASKFNFSSLIESESVPYSISDTTIKNKKFALSDDTLINADNVDIYSNYLDALSGKYVNAPESFMFVWNVPDNISGNVLSAAYPYSYYKLYSVRRLSTFVVSFEMSEDKLDFSKFPELLSVMKYIDTEDSFSVTSPSLALLGAERWDLVISGIKQSDFERRTLVSLKEITSLPMDIRGEYSYFDFSNHTTVSDWFGGVGCNSVKIDYNSVLESRSLNIYFGGERKAPNEYSEIYYKYEYPENLIFTPYISMVFSINSEDSDKDALYEVKLSYASGDTVSEVSRICRGNEKTEIFLDVSSFCDISFAEYIKINVRCLSENSDGYTMSLLSMTGHSSVYYSDELSEVIAEERLRIRNENLNSDQTETNRPFIILGVSIIVLLVGGGIFMCFKQDEE